MLSAPALVIFASTAYANENNCRNVQAEPNEAGYHHCDSQLGWYIGGQLGHAQTDISQSDVNRFYQQTGVDANSVAINDSDLAFSVMAGYQFSTHWAIEGAYIDLGERSVDFTGRTEDLAAFYDNIEHVYPQSADGLSLAIVGSWPLSNALKLSGKLGYWYWQGDYSTYDAQGNVGSDSSRGNDLWFGTELNYRVDKRIQVYLTAERFSLDRDDNNVFGLGVRYYFGHDYLPTKAVEKRIAVAEVVLDSDNDGVLDAQDHCHHSNILHQVDAHGCTVMTEQISRFDLTIYYAKDSVDIAPTYAEQLHALADYIKTHAVQQLTIYGYSSAPGFRAYNRQLSEQRAQAVADVLQAQYAIDKNIIKVIGRGEEVLFDTNNTETAHQLNRRVEIHIDKKLRLAVQR